MHALNAHYTWHALPLPPPPPLGTHNAATSTQHTRRLSIRYIGHVTAELMSCQGCDRSNVLGPNTDMA